METAKGKTREEIINRLADRIDSFEKYTEPHSRLMAALATRLARRCGLSAPDVAAVAEGATLHDIGLWSMSPAYHSQPGSLSFEARLDLWRHPIIGEQQMAKRDAGRHAQLLVRWHHEWWNGSGYPDALAFEDIPIAARIIRAVELYCALLSERPYRSAFSDEEALETLSASAGMECDPYMVKALLALLGDLREATTQPTDVVEASIAEQPDAQLMGGSLSNPVHNADLREDSLQTSGPFATPVELTGAPVNQPAQLSVEHSSQAQVGTPCEVDRSFKDTSPPPTVEVGDRLRAPAQAQPARAPRSLERLLSRLHSTEAEADPVLWRKWTGSRYNKKALLGFQASVLRQIEFRSIAIPSWSESRLDWYLKTWGKLIYANDARAWASAVARARVEPGDPLSEEIIARVLHDVYVPGVKLANPALSRWFGETDAWWMDNLHRNIDALEDASARARALTIGLHTGDYALSFNDETRELRRPLTTIFWRIAGREFAGAPAHPHNRTFNQPVEEFIKQARADLLFISLPCSRTDRGGAEARSDWREAWVTGSAESVDVSSPPQAKQSYLASVERLLRSATQFRTWAIEYQEPGLASAQEILDLVKEYRGVKATYSKDVTEVVGGLRSVMIVGEMSPR